MDFLSEFGFRSDGRKPPELRKIDCRLGVFSQADGSAYLEMGNTKVLVAVYGPHEVRRNRSRIMADRAIVNCQYSMTTFSTTERKFRPRGDRKSQEFTQHLQRTFEAAIRTQLYPRSQIDIFCEILQSDGANLSACINASTLALIDAGVPLRDYVASVTCGGQGENPLVDLNYSEEVGGQAAHVTVALLPRTDETVLMELSSRVHLAHLDKLVEAALTGCKEVRKILDEAVHSHLAKTATQLGW